MQVEDAAMRRAVELLDSGDRDALHEYLAKHPDLIHRRVAVEGFHYFQNPTLLEFVAENPIRNGTLPPNIVQVTKVILEAGAKDDRTALDATLGLVCSGRVPRECGVQIAMIGLLCDFGADPDCVISAALAHGEFEAVEALLRRGARVSLLVAAALGRAEDSRTLLAVAGSEERHGALALAAQFGHAPIVRMLLDAGEDPDRFNPAGFHAHSTPLHQAAFGDHMDAVRTLVEHGARLYIQDKLWQGTPADWAQYAGKTQVEAFLRAAQA